MLLLELPEFGVNVESSSKIGLPLLLPILWQISVRANTHILVFNLLCYLETNSCGDTNWRDLNHLHSGFLSLKEVIIFGAE